MYLSVVDNSSNEVKAICAADLLHNRLCILKEVRSGLLVWDPSKITKEEHIKKSYMRLAVIKKTLNDSLVAEIEKVLEEIRGL